MGVVLGGAAFGQGFERLEVWIALTVLSGVALFAVDLARSGIVLHQLSGVAVYLKLLLLGAGLAVPGQRFAWYLAATAVASVGSHMPKRWRHWSVLERRVV